jgi:hypothetical protein
MNKKLVALTSAVMLAAPLAIFAIANPNTPNTLVGFSVIGLVNTILNFIWPVFIGFAVIMFIIAAFYFITAQGEAEKVAEARQFIIWGVVGVAVGILAFTLPYVVQNAFGF